MIYANDGDFVIARAWADRLQQWTPVAGHVIQTSSINFFFDPTKPDLTDLWRWGYSTFQIDLLYALLAQHLKTEPTTNVARVPTVLVEDVSIPGSTFICGCPSIIFMRDRHGQTHHLWCANCGTQPTKTFADGGQGDPVCLTCQQDPTLYKQEYGEQYDEALLKANVLFGRYQLTLPDDDRRLIMDFDSTEPPSEVRRRSQGRDGKRQRS